MMSYVTVTHFFTSLSLIFAEQGNITLSQGAIRITVIKYSLGFGHWAEYWEHRRTCYRLSLGVRNLDGRGQRVIWSPTAWLRTGTERPGEGLYMGRSGKTSEKQLRSQGAESCRWILSKKHVSWGGICRGD